MSNGRNNGSSESSKPPENDSGQTLAQIVRAGEEAARMLQSPVYNMAHRMVLDEKIQAWAASQPKEREKRESLYYEVQALGAIAQTMAGMVERSIQVLSSSTDGPDRAERDYLDRQGFGIDPGNYN